MRVADGEPLVGNICPATVTSAQDLQNCIHKNSILEYVQPLTDTSTLLWTPRVHRTHLGGPVSILTGGRKANILSGEYSLASLLSFQSC